MVRSPRALIQDFEAFLDQAPHRGVRASVAARLQSSRTIRERSIETPAEEWDEAIFFVSEDSRFEGFELTPQMGLIPWARIRKPTCGTSG